jgi:hypothetical protein
MLLEHDKFKFDCSSILLDIDLFYKGTGVRFYNNYLKIRWHNKTITHLYLYIQVEKKLMLKLETLQIYFVYKQKLNN